MNLLASTTSGHENVSALFFQPIARTAEDRLRAAATWRHDVSCSANDGVAYLHGCLPSHYLKQLAQEIAAAVGGVRLVVNKIHVKSRARCNARSW